MLGTLNFSRASIIITLVKRVVGLHIVPNRIWVTAKGLQARAQRVDNRAFKAKRRERARGIVLGLGKLFCECGHLRFEGGDAS